jgi:hypothetical protein
MDFVVRVFHHHHHTHNKTAVFKHNAQTSHQRILNKTKIKINHERRHIYPVQQQGLRRQGWFHDASPKPHRFSSHQAATSSYCEPAKAVFSPCHPTTKREPHV